MGLNLTVADEVVIMMQSTFLLIKGKALVIILSLVSYTISAFEGRKHNIGNNKQTWEPTDFWLTDLLTECQIGWKARKLIDCICTCMYNLYLSTKQFISNYIN